jgi:rhodanese-related sulfurtransferase
MATETAELTTIKAENLKEKLSGDHPPILVNALTEDAYTARHIPGSINIPTKNAEWAEKVIPYKDAEIIVYCANEDCTASPELARKLDDMGYHNVKDFENGLAGWRSAGYDLIGNEA